MSRLFRKKIGPVLKLESLLHNPRQVFVAEKQWGESKLADCSGWAKSDISSPKNEGGPGW